MKGLFQCPPATDVWIYRRNCKIDKYLLASLLYNVNDVS